MEAAAKILNDAARDLWESPFIAFVVVLGAAQDLETLGEGFAGLASQLREFADTIDRREGEYDRESSRLEWEGNNMAAKALRIYMPR